MKTFRSLFMLAFLLLPSLTHAAEMDIVVSIPPQKEIIEALCDAQIEVLISPGQSPETWSPSPRTMARIAASDLYIPIGLPFEKSLRRKLRDIAPKLKICTPAAATPTDNALDPHVWLDPEGAIRHAEAVAGCLQSLPESRPGDIHTLLDAYIEKLRGTEKTAEELLAPCRGKEFLVYHPAFGHFARRFGLRQLAIEKDGKPPSAHWMTKVIQQAEDARIRTVFVQPSFASKTVRAIAGELQASVVQLDPLAEDLSRNILRIAEKIARTCSRDGRDTSDE